MRTDDALLARLRAEIGEAEHRVRDAETALTTAVAELQPVLAGDKRVSSAAVVRALDGVNATRALLARLGAILEEAESKPG